MWEDNGKIFFTASTNKVTNFGSIINLNGNADQSTNPQIAKSSNNVYAVWETLVSGKPDIFFTASTNKGANFGSVINLSKNGGQSTNPQIAAIGSNVYVVWEDNGKIFFTASTNKGARFGSVINLSNNAGQSTNPQIAAAGENVYVVWYDSSPGKRDIYLTISTNKGARFGSVINLSNNVADSFNPQIAASGKNVYVVWYDFSPGKPDIFLSKSTDKGSSFSDAINLSNNRGPSVLPQISIAAEDVYVVWEDFTPGKPDILFTSSTNKGSDFSSVASLGSKPVVTKTTTVTTSNLRADKSIEVVTDKGAKTISSYSETIVVKNTSNSVLQSVRLTLSPQISNSFILEPYSIKSIEPNGSVKASLKMLGKPNEDVYGKITGYSGYIMVTAANHNAVTLPVKISSSDSSAFDTYMKHIADMAQQRYTRTVPTSATIDSVLSKIKTDEHNDYQVSVTNGKNVITSASGQLVIKNTSNKELKNVRIMVSQPSNLFLLDKQTIDLIPPNGQVVVQMTSRIDGANPHRSFIGELIVSPVNSRPASLPINIPSTEKNIKDFDVRLLSKADKIAKMQESIIIKNTGTRALDGLRLILQPSNMPMAFSLSHDSFRSLSPGGEASAEFKLRADENLMEFTNSYNGELIIVSAHSAHRVVIPINMVWKDVNSKHFVIYSRDNPTDVSKAKELAKFLESKYKAIEQTFGQINSKTTIYVLSSDDELDLITNSPANYYYSYDHDLGFISAKSGELKEDALHVLVHRAIMKNNPSYWNKEKIVNDKGNWLVDGITDYVASKITGKQKLSTSELNVLAKGPALEWYSTGNSGNYVATYSFFKFLEDKYGIKIIGIMLDHMQSVMTSDKKCNTLENCSVIRAVYDVTGQDINDLKNKLNFDAIVKEWIDYLKPLSVTIDIEPGAKNNSLNTKKNEVVQVAILGSTNLDVTKVDTSTLKFGSDGAGPVKRSKPQDINNDGFNDLVIHFTIEKTGLKRGNTEGCLTGIMLDGRQFSGCDTVKIVTRA